MHSICGEYATFVMKYGARFKSLEEFVSDGSFTGTQGSRKVGEEAENSCVSIFICD